MKTPAARGAMLLARGLVASLALAGCGGRAPPPAPATPPPVPLHLSPACDLVPGAGLAWLVELKPREIAQDPELIPVVGAVLGEDRFRAYAEAHGGVDLRQIQDLCFARYGTSATLASVHVPLDPARVEKAFVARTATPPTRTAVLANPPVIRLDGAPVGDAEHLLVFGREHLVLATEGTGKTSVRSGPLRAAEAFALGRLKRSSPAVRTAGLAPVAALLGEGPVRVFVPGPFEGELANGLGGLLRASTGLGVAARPAGAGGRISVRVVVAGGFKEDAEAAAERLAASLHVLAETAFGRMLGLNRPLEGPTTRVAVDALVLDVTFDGMKAATGAHDVLEGDIAQVLRR